MSCKLKILTVMVYFFFNDPATTEIYTLSLHDALPISTTTSGAMSTDWRQCGRAPRPPTVPGPRSEEHTSELQSRRDLVCRLLLEKKNYTEIWFEHNRPSEPLVVHV